MIYTTTCRINVEALRRRGWDEESAKGRMLDSIEDVASRIRLAHYWHEWGDYRVLEFYDEILK